MIFGEHIMEVVNIICQQETTRADGFDSAEMYLDKDGWHITKQWNSSDENVIIQQG